MKTILLLRCLLVAAAMAVAATSAMAQGAGAKQLDARFAAADADHDGKLSKAEAKAGMPRVAQVFDQIDSEGSGFVTKAQIVAFLAKNK